jgi:hypothetical protein
MKKWMDKILIPISLIGSYGLMALIYLILIMLMGYTCAYLIAETLADPGPVLVISDLLLLAVIVFFFTRKKVRNGLKELCNQIFGSM